MSKISQILREYLEPIAKKVSEVAPEYLTDEKLETIFRMAHGSILPRPVQLFVREDAFVDFCMKNKEPVIEKAKGLKKSAEKRIRESEQFSKYQEVISGKVEELSDTVRSKLDGLGDKEISDYTAEDFSTLKKSLTEVVGDFLDKGVSGVQIDEKYLKKLEQLKEKAKRDVSTAFDQKVENLKEQRATFAGKAKRFASDLLGGIFVVSISLCVVAMFILLAPLGSLFLLPLLPLLFVFMIFSSRSFQVGC